MAQDRGKDMTEIARRQDYLINSKTDLDLV
jgi:hypothetical protein